MSSKLLTLFEKWLKPGRIWKDIILNLQDEMNDSDLSANARSGISYLGCVVFNQMCSKCDDGNAMKWMNKFAKAYLNNEQPLPQFDEGCWKEECKHVEKEDEPFEMDIDKEFRDELEDWLNNHNPETPYFLKNIIEYEDNQTLKISENAIRGLSYLSSRIIPLKDKNKKVVEWLDAFAIAYLSHTKLPDLDVTYLEE